MRAAFQLAQSIPWAIQEEWLTQILRIANRETDIKAVEAELGRPLDNTHATRTRNGVAVIPVTGPIFRYANLFTRISGGASIEILAKDFQAALKDPSVHSIVLDINSPGGEVTGVSELAQMIYAARGRKPILSYGDGLVCSAAYWLGSACSEMVVSDTAMLGSIGVVMAVPDPSQTKATDIEIVSSQSPNKRPNVLTEGGRGELQKQVDDLADVFIAAVAQHRGIDTETVVSQYGQGGVRVGHAAVSAGLADRVGTMESVIALLQQQHAERMRRPIRMTAGKGAFMDPTMIDPGGDPVATEAVQDTRVSELERQLAAMRQQVIQTNANAFVTQMLAQSRILPSESVGLTALYTVLAERDAESPWAAPRTFRAGETQVCAGSGVELLTTMLSARTPHALTTETVPADTTMLALGNPIGVSPQEKEQHAAAEREAQKTALMKQTKLGRVTLAKA